MTEAWKPRVSKRIELDDETSIVLMDMLNAPFEVPEVDVENNICRVTSQGRTIWQVSGARPVYPRSPFTGIVLDENGNLMAYSWDGGQFRINMETGVAELVNLTK